MLVNIKTKTTIKNKFVTRDCIKMPQNTILMVTENAYRSMKLLDCIILQNVLSITAQRAHSHDGMI